MGGERVLELVLRKGEEVKLGLDEKEGQREETNEIDDSSVGLVRLVPPRPVCLTRLARHVTKDLVPGSRPDDVSTAAVDERRERDESSFEFV
jgi:hypothetical protein